MTRGPDLRAPERARRHVAPRSERPRSSISARAIVNNTAQPLFSTLGESSVIGVDLINLQLDGGSNVVLTTTSQGPAAGSPAGQYHHQGADHQDRCHRRLQHARAARPQQHRDQRRRRRGHCLDHRPAERRPHRQLGRRGRRWGRHQRRHPDARRQPDRERSRSRRHQRAGQHDQRRRQRRRLHQSVLNQQRGQCVGCSGQRLDRLRTRRNGRLDQRASRLAQQQFDSARFRRRPYHRGRGSNGRPVLRAGDRRGGEFTDQRPRRKIPCRLWRSMARSRWTRRSRAVPSSRRQAARATCSPSRRRCKRTSGRRCKRTKCRSSAR